jgi:hypothetical protein
MLPAAFVVIQLVGVLAAIQLDDQHGAGADEIGDVLVDLVLAAEVVTAQLSVAQSIPQLSFGIGHGLAQSARSVDVLTFHP